MSAAKVKPTETKPTKAAKQKGYIAAYKLKMQEDEDASKRLQDVMMLWGVGHV